jgi:hypothetical protein
MGFLSSAKFEGQIRLTNVNIRVNERILPGRTGRDAFPGSRFPSAVARLTCVLGVSVSLEFRTVCGEANA